MTRRDLGPGPGGHRERRAGFLPRACVGRAGEGRLKPHVRCADVSITGQPGNLADRLDHAQQAWVVMPLVRGDDLGHGAKGTFLAPAQRGADVDHRADQPSVVRG